MLSFRLRKLNYVQQRGTEELHISGVGLHETMEPMLVNRAGGTRDRLLMFFHTPVELKEHGQWRTWPAGTLRLWPDQAGHFYGNRTGIWSHSWVHFYGSFAEELIASLHFSDDEPLLLKEAAPFEKALEDLFGELVRPEPDPDILKALFEVLLRTTIRSLRNPGSGIPERLQQLKILLDAEAGKTMDLEEMAAFCRMSRAKFCAQFKTCFQESPGQYQLNRRLDHAMLQLLDRSKNVTDVAGECGYSSVQAFSKAFRERTGHSPLAWRNR